MKIKLQDIVTAGQLACILEVTCPKPGNVSKFHDFKDTKYEHFLASSVAIGEALREACIRGKRVSEGKLKVEEIGIGSLIKKAIYDTKKWHLGKNTNLGIVMLLIPLSASIAMVEKLDLEKVRENIDKIIKATTYRDAIEFYEAVKFTMPNIGKAEKLDVFDESSIKKIVKEKISFYEIMKLSTHDSIARELLTKMKITFEIGYPTIIKVYKKEKDLNKAILTAFMKILSEVPDSLIERKNGREVAEEVSKKAKVILGSGLKKHDIEKFDRELRKGGNKLNPGTTADLVTSSLMIALLKDAKP